MISQGTQCYSWSLHCIPKGNFHFANLAESPSHSPTRLSLHTMLPLPFLSLLSTCMKPAKATLASSEPNPACGWQIRTFAVLLVAQTHWSSCGHAWYFTCLMARYRWLPWQGWVPSPSANDTLEFLSGLLRKNIGSDKLGWAGCWWVAGVGWGQPVAAQPPPSCSLTFPQMDEGENWKAKSDKKAWVKMKAV